MTSKTSVEVLFSDLREWLFASDSLASKMEAFAKENCREFSFCDDREKFLDTENRIQHTELYNRFQELFESELKEFLSNHGWDVPSFLAAVEIEAKKEKLESGSSELGPAYELMLTLTDFSAFKIMMMDARADLGP